MGMADTDQELFTLRWMQAQPVVASVLRAMLRDPSAVDDLLQETAVTAYQVPGVYLTPHRTGGLMASVERGLTWLVDDYERVLRGEPLQHALVPAMVARLDG